MIKHWKTTLTLLSLTVSVATPLVVVSCSSKAADTETNEEDVVRTEKSFATEDLKYASADKVLHTTDYGNVKTLAFNRYMPFENNYIDVNASNAQKRIVFRGEDETIRTINDFERAKVEHAKYLVDIIQSRKVFKWWNSETKREETLDLSGDEKLATTRRILVNNYDIASEIRKLNDINSSTNGIKSDIASTKAYDDAKTLGSNAYRFAKLGITSPEVYNVYTAFNNVTYKTKNAYNHYGDTSARKVTRSWANIDYNKIKTDTFAYYSPNLFPEITSTHAYFKYDSRFAKWLGEDNVSKKIDSGATYIQLSSDEGGVKSGFTKTVNGKTQFVPETDTLGVEQFTEVDKLSMNDLLAQKFEPESFYFINTVEAVPGTIHPSWQYKLKVGADGNNFGYFENNINGVKTYMPLKNISYSVKWKRHLTDAAETKHYFGTTTNIEPVDADSGVGQKDSYARDKMFGAFSSTGPAKNSLILRQVSKGIYVNNGEGRENDLILDLSNRTAKISTPDSTIDPNNSNVEFNYYFIDGELVLAKRTVTQ